MRFSHIHLYVFGFGIYLAIPQQLWTSINAITTRRNYFQDLTREEYTLTEILRNIIDGSLKGHDVTLVIPEGNPKRMSLDLSTFIPLVRSPVSILEIPLQDPKYENKSDTFNVKNSRTNNNVNSNISNGNFGLSDQDLELDRKLPRINYPAKTSVVVMIMPSDVEFWWPFWSPPEEWIPSTLLLVSTKTCGLFYNLESPLAEKASSVSLLCLQVPRDPSARGSFRVITWLPFTQGHRRKDLGEWSQESFEDSKDLFVDRYKDMRNKNISVLAIQDDAPLVYATVDGKPSGLNVNILRALSKWLQFQIIIDLTAGELWENLGIPVKTGERDVLINFSTNTPERYREFDLSVAYHYEGFSLVLEVPKPLPRWQSLLHPLTWPVWITSLVSLFATALVFHSLRYKQDSSFVSSLVIIGQSFLSHPLGTVPLPWRIRSFLLQWWIASWLLELSWICNLIAVLMIPAYPRKIQTKSELVLSDYRLCMLDYGEFVPEALRTSSESTLWSLGKKLDLVPLMVDWPEFGQEGCVELVVAGTHAQTDAYSYISLVYSRMGHASTTYMLREQLYPAYLSFRFQKHTPWKHKFDDGIQRLYESGLIQLWFQQAMDESRNNSQAVKVLLEQEGQAPLSIEHLEGAFYILILGLLLSLVVLMGELLTLLIKDGPGCSA